MTASDITGAKLRLVAYLRVSTARQVDGYGLADQEKQVRAWCRQRGYRLVRIIKDEGKSGTLDAAERPGLLDVLKAVKAREADGVVMRDLDRIARTLTVQEAVLAQLWKLGGHAFIVTSPDEIPADDPDDPMRTAMRQMAGVFAQLERAMAIKRMRNGRQVKADQGGYAFGSPAFGLRAAGKALAPDEREQEAIARIAELDSEGKSLREIIAALESEGVPSKRGGRWHPATVNRVLTRLKSGRELRGGNSVPARPPDYRGPFPCPDQTLMVDRQSTQKRSSAFARLRDALLRAVRGKTGPRTVVIHGSRLRLCWLRVLGCLVCLVERGAILYPQGYIKRGPNFLHSLYVSETFPDLGSESAISLPAQYALNVGMPLRGERN
jgi:DNA invertase Pin-like site-specific DNA recombinase